MKSNELNKLSTVELTEYLSQLDKDIDKIKYIKNIYPKSYSIKKHIELLKKALEAMKLGLDLSNKEVMECIFVKEQYVPDELVKEVTCFILAKAEIDMEIEYLNNQLVLSN